MRNYTARYNLYEDNGWAGHEVKSVIEGTTRVHHNVVRRAGSVAAAANDFGHSTCLVADGTLDVEMYNNRLEDCGGAGMAFRAQYIPSTVVPSMTCKAYNNVIVRGGYILGQSGIGGSVVSNSNPPTMNCEIYNNTIVDSASFSISDGNISDTWTATENIACNGPIVGSITTVNNNTSACSSQGFADYVGGDFDLTSGSSNVDAGTQPGFPSFDIRDVSRPQGAAHDIGAHEFFEGGSDPPPTFPAAPTGLTVD
jgi:hypothetical protein